jgi:plasmid stabilization system protein ParE
MMRLVHSSRSLEDCDYILSRIGGDNPAAAVRLGEDILRTCKLFESHPQMGERKDDLAKGMRRFMCRGYALYYRIDENNQVVKLLRILHPKLDGRRQTFYE